MQFVEQRAVALGLSAARLYAHEAMTEKLGFYTTLDDGETERRVEDGYAGVLLQKPIG